MSDVDAVLTGLAESLAGSAPDTAERRRYLVVADGILAAIGAGRLSPGDRLPNERDLARICDTSRTTVVPITCKLRHEAARVERAR